MAPILRTQKLTGIILFPGKKTQFTKNRVGLRILFNIWLHTTVIFFMEERSKLQKYIGLSNISRARLLCAADLSAVVVAAHQAALALLVPVTVALARHAGLSLGAAPTLVNLPPGAAKCLEKCISSLVLNCILLYFTKRSEECGKIWVEGRSPSWCRRFCICCIHWRSLTAVILLMIVCSELEAVV